MELPAAVAKVNPFAEKYRKRDVTGDGLDETWCNVFAVDVCAELGVHLPQMRANDQMDWLDGDAGRAAGWVPCAYHEAGERAQRGERVLVGWRNPAGHPGHIALVLDAELHIAQSGRHNYAWAPLTSGFGNLPVRFWSHA